MTKLTQQQIDFIKNNKATKTRYRISVELGISQHVINNYFKDENLQPKVYESALLTDDIKRNIIKTASPELKINNLIDAIGCERNDKIYLAIYSFLERNLLPYKKIDKSQYGKKIVRIKSLEPEPEKPVQYKRPPTVYSNPNYAEMYLNG